MAKILLVDDSSFKRKNTSKLLRELGHEVISAENGQVGMSVARAEQPDLIITDLLMPVMDGISYLRNLQNDGIRIPTIVTSADIQESTRQECLKLGARAFLSKPLKPADIERAINQALETPTGETLQC